MNAGQGQRKGADLAEGIAKFVGGLHITANGAGCAAAESDELTVRAIPRRALGVSDWQNEIGG